jgi:hypothetical protein
LGAKLRRRNVRTHHGASYRPDGEAMTARRRPKFVEITFVVAVSTIGRTVVRPYISPRLILTQPQAGGRRIRLSSHSAVVARSSLRAITFVCARFASLRLTSIAPTHARNGRLQYLRNLNSEIRYTYSSKSVRRICVPFYFVSDKSVENMYLLYLLL